VDWVILQRFANLGAATGWLNSQERSRRIAGVEAMLVGGDDVHIVRDGEAGVLPAPVSAVISRRIKPGQEAVYRTWEQRIGAAQSRRPAFRATASSRRCPGCRTTGSPSFASTPRPTCRPGSIRRSATHCWREAKTFTEEYHTRIVRTGFEQWFPLPAGATAAPPAWKQNMLVLLMLYPVVFLFGAFVQTPYLSGRSGLPFAIALFIGNVVSVLLLNYLVPWVSNRFAWWLQPHGAHERRAEIGGAIVLVVLYALMVLVFWRLC
jgi:uncharacterized protein